MCGISGLVALGEGDRRVSEATALRMATRLSHRGPDGVRAFHDGRCALGHSRLEVIDLETGDQPMSNEDGSLHVVFNGEIYNFQELRRELAAAGHQFRTRSDTEVIVHGYREWGDAVVERLDGMFAFALWDGPRQRLLLARDRAGKKPLFVYRDGHVLVFASEIKAIFEVEGLDTALRPEAFPLYLAYGYVPAPATFYKCVNKLPPATTMVIEREGEPREASYWKLDFTPRPIGRTEAEGRVRELMRDAVRRRLVADVPLGAFLSGGVDSTIVVGLMAEMMDEPVRTFSIGFEDDPYYDETYYARMAAEGFGTNHTEFKVPAQAVDLVGRLVEHYDEPFGDSSAIPTYIVSQLTREHVTVSLTGDGGDEMFAGYARFRGAQIAEGMPGWMVTAGNAIGRRLPYNPNFRGFSRRVTRFFGAASMSTEERTLRWIGFFADRLDEMLRPELSELLTREDISRSFREPLEGREALSPLARALAINFETYLPEDLLVKSDRCSMAHGLELRSPFLDTALMECAAALPDGHKIRGRHMKSVLKSAFRDLLPDAIRSRPKMGFGIPLPTWFRNQWRPLLEERVLANDARIWEWINPEPVRAMAREHLEGRADFGHQLWALLTLEEWLRRRPTPPESR